jgi:hypothetical protein
MIPPRILRQLAQTLTERTRSKAVTWLRTPEGPLRYIHRLANGEIVLRYDPSRGASDTIEFAVVDLSGQVIGSLVAEENEPLYDTLGDLLFEVQRATDHGALRVVTDEILDILKG